MNIKYNKKKIFYKMGVLFTFNIICLIIISYYIIKGTLDSFNSRVNARQKIIEDTVASSIADANQIMYGLAMMLTHEPIEPNNKNISRLLKSFDPRISNYKSIPLSCFRLINPNWYVVSLTSIDDKLFMSQPNIFDNDLIAAAMDNKFELQVGAIRHSRRANERIIPLCLAFNNAQGKHSGTLCSGLLVNKMNQILLAHNAVRSIKEIKLYNIKELKDVEGYYKPHEIFTISNLFNLFKYVSQNKNLLAYLTLKNYPISVVVELRLQSLVSEISVMILACLGNFILLLITFALFLKIIRNFYDKHIYKLYDQISNLSKVIPAKKKFSLKALSIAMDDITTRFHALESKLTHTGVALDLQNNIVDFVFIERCSSAVYKNAPLIDYIFIDKVKQYVNEPIYTSTIKVFLERVCSSYQASCKETKLNIVIANLKEESRVFSCYQDVLIEAIHNIFHFISDNSYFVCNVEVVINAIFEKQNASPTFFIEVGVDQSTKKILPSNVHLGGLLGIYLIAKNAHFFFYVKDKGNKITFYLEPLNMALLAKINTDIMEMLN